MTNKLEQKTFSHLKTIDARFARTKKLPKAKRLKNLKNLCENLRELCVTKTLRKTLLH